jgi:hypothetical protein
MMKGKVVRMTTSKYDASRYTSRSRLLSNIEQILSKITAAQRRAGIARYGRARKSSVRPPRHIEHCYYIAGSRLFAASSKVVFG